MSDCDHLYILWASGDPVTSEKMVFMYGINALKKAWWQKVTIIVWGASAALAADNAVIQEKIEAARSAGLCLTGCKACADQLGVSKKLTALGIELQYAGSMLTDILKSGARLLTI